MAWLLPCAIHRDCLEHPSEASTGPECSSVGSDRHTSECLCETSTLQAALVASMLQVWFNMLDIIYKTLHNIGRDYLKNHLSPLDHMCWYSWWVPGSFDWTVQLGSRKCDFLSWCLPFWMRFPLKPVWFLPWWNSEGLKRHPRSLVTMKGISCGICFSITVFFGV